eukprot:2228312-Rhodomonas_salina.1
MGSRPPQPCEAQIRRQLWPGHGGGARSRGRRAATAQALHPFAAKRHQQAQQQRDGSRPVQHAGKRHVAQRRDLKETKKERETDGGRGAGRDTRRPCP